MLEQPPRVLLAYAAALVAILLVGARWLEREPEAAPAAEAPAMSLERAAGGRVIVHVAGAVRRPGVYRLARGARVDDAVRRAGGATSRADLSQVNLAAKVEDGRQVLVPVVASQAAGVAAPAAGVTAAELPVNLNTATLEQLDQLDGIGPATAQQILDYREEKSGFGSVDELAQVPGIGPKRLESMREQVRV